jgi:Domain of unknown function (DUF4760)
VTPEWLTAIGTLGTFLVIAASAIAALIQLRHMRGSNQIAALTEFRETMESDKFQTAQTFVSFELPKRLKDPVERVKATTLPFSGEYAATSTVANMFESLGGLIKSGVIDRDVACDVVAYIVVRNWEAMLPLTTYLRRTLDNPALWENFEYLTLLSKRFHAKHPRGAYPRGEPRLPEDDSLIRAITGEANEGES